MAVVTSREDSAARTGASARERARRPSAGQILEGEVIRSGRSGLVVNATLKPLGHDGAGIAASAMGSVDSLPQILDRLAAALLARAGGEDERHVGRLVQVSLPALKLYLAGRAAYRRGDYDDAVARLQRAIAAEPAFALAALELADAAGERFRLRPVEPALSTDGWPAEMDSIWLGGIELARASEATLDGADRAYLDLLAGPRFPQGTPAIEQLTAWEHASERWPERAEIWLHFGELLLYGGPSAGIEDSRTRAAAAFQRARQANPELAGPLLGLIEIAAFDRDSSAVEHLGSTFLTRDSVSGWADYVRWRVASVVDTQSLAVLREKFDSLDSGRLGRIQWTAQVDGPAALDADRAAAILHHRASNFAERQVACVETTHLRINEGRPAAALAAIDDFRTLDDQLYCNPVLWVYYGMYWDGDTTRAAQVAEELRTYYTAWRAGGGARSGRHARARSVGPLARRHRIGGSGSPLVSQDLASSRCRIHPREPLGRDARRRPRISRRHRAGHEGGLRCPAGVL